MEEIKGGLLPLPKDNRDFSLGAVFGRIGIEEVPHEDFEIAEPLYIENQKKTDFCVAFALSSVTEDQEGVDLCPIYPFAKIKQLRGEYKEWGANLRDGCKVAVKVGFIKKIDSPFTIDEDRDFLANWNNWPKELDEKALEHRKGSYLALDGYKDLFDAIRASMWQHRAEKRTILTGCNWDPAWVKAKDGIIPELRSTIDGMGHALKIYGQKIIWGKIYLKAQLSNGESIGENGIFYFPRSVINRDFFHGAFMFKDLDPDEAKKVCWSIWRRIWESIKNFFKNLFK